MERITVPVVIIGAGPAGCNASFQLANKSIQHILIDKNVFPRDKICGDALSGRVIDELYESKPNFLKEFINREDLFVPCPGIRFFGPNLKQVDIPFPSRKMAFAPGYVAKRVHFDKLLVEYLDPNFCTLYQNAQELSFPTKNIVRFKVGNKEFEVKYKLILGADGARSKVAEHFLGRIIDKEHHSSAVRAYYKNVVGFNSGFIELYFLKNLLPGYFWVFPLPNGEANVGLGMLTSKIVQNNVNLRKKLLEIIDNHPLFKERFKNAELIDGVKGWGLPLGSKKRKISGDGFMLLGDAAWLIDPFTGEGIGNAMLSGSLAAKWAFESLKLNDFSAKMLKSYEDEIYSKLGNELKLSHKLQKLSSIKWLFNFLINKATGSKQLQETMTLMYTNLDMRAKLNNPFFYLKILLGY